VAMQSAVFRFVLVRRKKFT